MANGLPDQRLYLAADSAGCRVGSELDRLAAQRCLLDVVDAAVAAAGLPRLAWNQRHGGQGELAELQLDEPLCVDRLAGELDAELFRYNVTRRRTDRLRLRVAVHHGQNSRLVDAVVLQQAMRICPHACLGMLVAAEVFDGPGTRMRREWLRKVRVTTAAFSGAAWLLIPGHDVHALRLRGSGDRLPRARAPSGGVVQYQAESVPQSGADRADPVSHRRG